MRVRDVQRESRRAHSQGEGGGQRGRRRAGTRVRAGSERENAAGARCLEIPSMTKRRACPPLRKFRRDPSASWPAFSHRPRAASRRLCAGDVFAPFCAIAARMKKRSVSRRCAPPIDAPSPAQQNSGLVSGIIGGFWVIMKRGAKNYAKMKKTLAIERFIWYSIKATFYAMMR